MANNNNLFNAVIAGAGGGNQQRWITETSAGDYAEYQAIIEQLATAIDDAIAAIPGDANVAQAALMQSITAAVFADRFLQSFQQANFEPIINSIVALYTSLAAVLESPTVPTSGGGLTNVVFVDPNTTVDEGEQDGSAVNPFGTLQLALTYLMSIQGGTVILVNGDYTGARSTATLTGLEEEVYTIRGSGNTVNLEPLTVEGQCEIYVENLAIETITCTEGASLYLKDCLITANIVAETSAVETSNTNIIGTILAASLDGKAASSYGDNLTITNDINVNDCQFNGAILSGNGLTATDCLFVNPITITGDAILNNCRVASTLDANSCTTNGGEHNDDITVTADFSVRQGLIVTDGAIAIACASANLQDTKLGGSIVASADVTLDVASWGFIYANGGTVTAGTTIVFNNQLSDTVEIAVPAIGTATDVTYVDTSLVGTGLEGAFQVDSPVIVNPQGDIPGAGAAIASARISAANTLRVGFRGVTTGGALNFTVTRP